MRRRTLLQGLAASALAAPALAQKVPTLRFVPQSNLAVLDPIWTTATVTGNHGYYVYDMLYAVDAKLQPRPQMAEGHEVADDGRTWRFRLREGLRFHDNTPVRAQDCIASIKRWAVREPIGQLLARVAAEYVNIDDRTFEIRLTRPFPLMLEALAKPDSSNPFIMPERIAATDPMKPFTEVVGSGPYRFLPDEYVSGSRVAYAKFDLYVPRKEPPEWATGAKIAYFPRIEWNIIPDPATAGAALMRGEVDWWERPLNDLLPTLRKAQGVQTEIQDRSGRMALMRLNHLQPPFNDKRIRQAVLMSVDQEEYMRAANGDDPALWKVCPSIYPCGTPYESFTAARRLMRGDLDAARRMLQEAGYAGQRVVIINPTDYPQIGPLGQVTADRLRRIGMNVDLQESDWGTVVQRRTSREPVEKGGWSIFHTTGSSPGYSNPAVSTLVRGQGEKGWFGWWNGPKAEEMVQQWLEAPDPAERERLGQAIGDLALEEVATVPLGMFYVRTAFRAGLTGMLEGPAPYPWNIRPA
ncbi:MAG TPA: ABC transporter substrate-binding protein [Acetobacteraceae bacterium]|jgi:peptide/nickel transport system substrate-binding protein|nr:ABC transporter substrate-binding protein [Acetobacteraceae bacterium]